MNKNDNTTRAAGDVLKKKVEAALAQVRPYLQGDGGDVELVEIDETAKTVKVRLTGGCRAAHRRDDIEKRD